jgi:DNA-binding transcriptional ArsR family regulator
MDGFGLTKAENIFLLGYISNELIMVPPLDSTFAALADPTRRAILARLADGEATVMDLAEPFDLSQPAISKHLKVLEKAGLITRRRDAQRRPCKLDADRLAEATEWLASFRRFWGESFDRLDLLLDEMRADATPTASSPDGAADRPSDD